MEVAYQQKEGRTVLLQIVDQPGKIQKSLDRGYRI